MPGLFELLENAAVVAKDHRAQQHEAELRDIVDMEDHGESYALALTLLDEEAADRTIDDCEKALRLGLKLDDEDDAARACTEALDAEIARKVASAEELAASADERMRGKMEASDAKMAQKIAERLRSQAARTAKLEVRQKKLAEKLLLKGDEAAVKNLLQEIEAEEMELVKQEKSDRKLASELRAKDKTSMTKRGQNIAESAHIKSVKLARQLSREENGGETASLGTMLRVKLGALRNDISNRMEKAA